MNGMAGQVLDYILGSMADDLQKVEDAKRHERLLVAELTRCTRLELDRTTVKTVTWQAMRGDDVDRLRERLKTAPKSPPAEALGLLDDGPQAGDAGRKPDDTDTLGAYKASGPRIELYWLKTALVARRRGWNVTDLALVVLAHEWAHAFTHLGRDADGQPMDKCAFDGLPREVREGMAQYWMHYALKARPEWAAAFHLYVELSKKQSPAYRVHTAWIPESDFADFNYTQYVRRDGPGRLPGLLPPRRHIRERVRQCFAQLTRPPMSALHLNRMDEYLSLETADDGDWVTELIA